MQRWLLCTESEHFFLPNCFLSNIHTHLYFDECIGKQLGVSILPKDIWHADWKQPGIHPPSFRLAALPLELQPQCVSWFIDILRSYLVSHVTNVMLAACIRADKGTYTYIRWNPTIWMEYTRVQNNAHFSWLPSCYLCGRKVRIIDLSQRVDLT